jgi:hypothetical protein
MNSREIKHHIVRRGGERSRRISPGFWLREIAYQLALRNELDALPEEFRVALQLLNEADKIVRPLELKKTKNEDAPVSNRINRLLDKVWLVDDWGSR